MAGPIRGAQIAKGANGIGTANLVDGAVTTPKLGAEAVTDAKVNGTVVVADGSHPFTGDQSMGDNKVTDLKAPTNPNDSARLVDVEQSNFLPRVFTKDISVTGAQTLLTHSVTIADGVQLIIQDGGEVINL